MPQTDGESALGYQRLVYIVDASSSLVRILLNPQYELRPEKLGFYYVIVSTDGGFEKYVFDSGLLYAPGVVVFIPERCLLIGNKIAVWVNWDAPNVAWSVIT